MSTLAHPERSLVNPTLERHRQLRWAAVALSALVAILYGVFFVIVRGVETDPDVSDATYPAYAFLAVAYLVSAMAYAALDRRAVWQAGAVLQVVVLGLFVVFGIGLLGPGLFEYEILVEATPVGVWAGVITGLQVVLLGVLGYLASLEPAGRHAA